MALKEIPHLLYPHMESNFLRLWTIIDADTKMSGTYAIILRLKESLLLNIGRKEFDLSPGFYVYVGSALGPGGVDSRLRRHLLTFSVQNTKKHWHIDSLLPHSTVFLPLYAQSPDRLECALVRSFKEMGFLVIKGFGDSDCKSGCGGHLIQIGDVDLWHATQKVLQAFANIGLKAVLGTAHEEKV